MVAVDHLKANFWHQQFQINCWYAALSPFLHQQGRSIERVLGDGNCLFRSLSHQLTGTQDHHLILRKTITKFEQSYYGMFQQLHNTINRTPFSSHIKNMKKTCIWGTTVETRVPLVLYTYPVPRIHLHCTNVSYSSCSHVTIAKAALQRAQPMSTTMTWTATCS